MQTVNWKTLVAKIAGVILLLLVLCVLIGLQNSILTTIRYYFLPTPNWDQLSAPVSFPVRGTPPPDPDEVWFHRFYPSEVKWRAVNFSAKPDVLSVQFVLAVPSSGDAARVITSGRIADDPASYASALFGTVSINYEELVKADFDAPEWTIDQDSGEMILVVTASREVSSRPWYHMSMDPTSLGYKSDRDRITLKLEGARVQSIWPVPDTASSDLLVMKDALWDESGQVRLVAQFEPSAASTTTPARVKDALSRQGLLQRLGDSVQLPLLSAVLYSIGEALPLLIFLLYLRRNKDEARSTLLDVAAAALTSLLLFHFVLYMVNGLSDLLSDPTVSTSTLDPIRMWLDWRVGAPGFWLGAPYAGIVLAGLLFPFMFRSQITVTQSVAPRWRRLLFPLVVALLWLPAIGIAGGLVAAVTEGQTVNFMTPTFGIWLLAAGTLVACGILLVLLIVSRMLVQKGRSLTVVWLAAWLLMMLSLSWAFSRQASTYSDIASTYLWPILDTVLGAVLILAIAFLLLRAVTVMLPDFELPRWLRVCAWPIAVALAIPWNPTNPGLQTGYMFVFLDLGFIIDDFIPLMFAAAVLWYLFEQGKHDVALGHQARFVAILLLASLFFRVGSSWWLYIPVGFLLGWLLLQYAIRPASDWGKLDPLFHEAVVKRNDLLEQVININAAEGAHWEYRKKMTEQLAKGELTSAAFSQKLKNRRSQLDQLREKSKVNDQALRDIALAFGPFPSAWKNAIHGMKWALVFSLPWSLLYLQEFLRGTGFSHSYPLLSFLTNLLYYLGRWAILGFAFGYLFPYLKGKTGVTKGLFFALLLILPSLPSAAINNLTFSAWQTTLFGSLQIFIECLLLGLLGFDYETLREGGRGVQMLLEVHGLPSLGISVSAILLAIGAALTTLLTSQLSSLVGVALQLFIPQFPNVPLPK